MKHSGLKTKNNLEEFMPFKLNITAIETRVQTND